MKKFLATILCFVYVVASSGATINLHYCMGKFIGWDISASSSKKCSNCGMMKKEQKGCCNDKHQTIQLKKDQLSPQINFVPLINVGYLTAYYFSLEKIFVSASSAKSYTSHGPPGTSVIPSFLLNCVFRI